MLVARFCAWFLYTGIRVNCERVGGFAGIMATATAERATERAGTPTPTSPPFARTPLGPGRTPATVVVVRILTPAR